MNRSVAALLAFTLCLFLAGCGTFGSPKDDKKTWTAEQWYRAAKDELDAGNWQAAVKFYEQLESRFPYGKFAQQAQLDSAYALYKEGETAQAVTTLDRFIKAYPNHQALDYALYLKALANFKEDLGPLATYLARQDLADRDPKAARESFEIFKELITRFPESRYADDSRRRMEYLVDALARNELNVASYYLRRGAWLAAANRAQGVVTRFPNAPSRRQALDVMVEAYDRMGMVELRDDAKKVLAKNYPGDRMGEAGSNRAKSGFLGWPWW
ncbi:MAG: outer membrane protein assembly factor BamD [Betaproteobacteria bacterium]|nr:outer membrane protein assembly factor BamD [Betaproteobacteria bacterium]